MSSPSTDILSTTPAPDKRRSIGARFGGLDAVTAVIALILAIPVLSVFFSATFADDIVFSHLASTVLGDYVLNTALLGVMVGAGVVLLGVPTAWLVATCAFPGRRLLEAALVLPLAAPAYVLSYAYADFLSAFGPVQSSLRSLFGAELGSYWFPDIRTLPGVALMLTLVLYPYVYLLVRARFLSESGAAWDAARSLGRSPWSAFLSVSLPLARPAIAAGAALALMETFADYGTVSYYGVPVFTTGIYRAWFSFGDPAAAAKLAALLILFVALALSTERWARGGARFHETGRRDFRPKRMQLRGMKSALAISLCALPPLLGFALPCAVLLSLLLRTGLPGREFSQHLINSFTLAALAALAATAIAFILAFALKTRPKTLAGRAAGIAGLGYAVPGAVIAIGVLAPFAFFDNAVDSLFRNLFGVSTGLVLTGSAIGLIFAYVVRYLAVALQSVSSGMERITPSISGAARMLGRGNGDSLRRVYLPLLSPSALTAVLLVFVDVMKELPATLMLRPFNFDTLAVAAHNYAADERLGFAAAPSLALVAAGIIPCFLLIHSISSAAQRQSGPTPP
jgi:iron(III) transport system permease protein